MSNTLKRNFMIFVIILMTCAGVLTLTLISGEQGLDQTDDLIVNTQKMITEAEQLSTNIEGMLSSQRGYILSQEDYFLEEYESKKQAVSEHIAALSDLNKDKPGQMSRLQEVRDYYTQLAMRLEERANVTMEEDQETRLNDVNVIDGLKNNITARLDAILKQAYSNLDLHVKRLDSKRSEYFSILLIGIIVGTVILLLLNWFLLNAQRQRSHAETSLKDTEDRMALAIDGTQDGIFDWDIKKEAVFYSRQFFAMLGYDQAAKTGKIDEFKDLLHPDDLETAWAYIEQYLSGGLSEYNQEFRLRHETGRWVWVQARAKALFDNAGNPYRMVGAHTDITHLIKAKEKLEKEKEAAEDANRAKSDFLAHMSHEIRTPLTAISGISEILLNDMDSLNEKQQKFIHTLSSSTSALKDIINDVLDFSKIESGELELDEKSFSLNDLFEETISIMSLKASEKGISFLFDYSDTKDLAFYGDQIRMRQILINLIGNAVKFTNEGAVTISTRTEDRNGEDFLRIDISDTGEGIPPEKLDFVFERFKQADETVSRKYGGTGLGLPISRNLAQLMSGDIFLSSEVGKGSTFSVLLPMKISGSIKTTASDTISNQKISDKIRASLLDTTKVLLVEDYKGNVVVIGHILEEVGLSYDVAKNGLDGVNLWAKNHYDLILMDIQMPVMDGFAATKKIRGAEEQDSLPRTPIIGITAHALVGDKDKCIAVGMDSYLPKPIVDADLKREILKYLKKDKEEAA